ncbi:MAG: hypothetical protein ACOCXL_03430, partial [Halanaerobium sp.]
EEGKKEYSVNYLLGKERTHVDLSHEEGDKLDHLQAGTKNLIDQGYSQSEVLSKLDALGLSDETALILYDSAAECDSMLADAQLINNIDDELFSNFISFIIEEYLLFGYYNLRRSDSFSELNEFIKPNHADRIWSVINYKVMEVLRRFISLPKLRKELLDEFELEEPKANIFVNLIDQNLKELEKTFMVRSFQNIERELTKIKKGGIA